MLIAVKQKHIDSGSPGKCGRCPIALSLKDAGLSYVAVGRVSFGYGRLIERKRVLLPVAVSQFIGDFDKGYPVVPFSFELEGI